MIDPAGPGEWRALIHHYCMQVLAIARDARTRHTSHLHPGLEHDSAQAPT